MGQLSKQIVSYGLNEDKDIYIKKRKKRKNMKNILTFEQFINESKLNESVIDSKLIKKAIKISGDMSLEDFDSDYADDLQQILKADPANIFSILTSDGDEAEDLSSSQLKVLDTVKNQLLTHGKQQSFHGKGKIYMSDGIIMLHSGISGEPYEIYAVQESWKEELTFPKSAISKIKIEDLNKILTDCGDRGSIGFSVSRFKLGSQTTNNYSAIPMLKDFKDAELVKFKIQKYLSKLGIELPLTRFNTIKSHQFTPDWDDAVAFKRENNLKGRQVQIQFRLVED